MSEAGCRFTERENTVPVAAAEAVHESPAPLLQLDDAALVEAAKGGQNWAFDVLVVRHWRKIVSVALRLTRIREDAEDIAQQSFQRAFTHLSQFEGRSSFSTWVTRIAINEAIMWLRKRRSLEVPIDNFAEDDALLAQDFRDPGLSPEESCIRLERERFLSAAMKNLTPARRRAIELYALDGLSIDETSRCMDLSVSAVKSHVLRARRSLRRLLKHLEITWHAARQPSPALRKTNGLPGRAGAWAACD